MGQVNFNAVIFPSPKSSYKLDSFDPQNIKDGFYKYSNDDRLIYIKSKKYLTNQEVKVPCLLLPFSKN